MRLIGTLCLCMDQHPALDPHMVMTEKHVSFLMEVSSLQAAKGEAACVLESLAVFQATDAATSVRAAISRLPEDGEAALEAMPEWQDVTPDYVLLSPARCCGAWRQLLSTSNAMVQQVSRRAKTRSRNAYMP